MSDDEDDFISFGKPLKELVEGENIRKRPITVEEQIATDENGKRRFHGAFTGGFSAGFFNTVDTPQGWVPSQFKSSREVRTERQGQKPEDFMDTDDFGDFGFAPHALRTKSSFQSKKPEERTEKQDKDLFAPVLDRLIQPARSTIGETLLIKQGWKPGQGIGPKSIKKQKKDRKQSYAKTYGEREASRVEEEEDPTLEKYQDFLFAPDDLPVFVASPKENFFGMGYRGLERGENPRHQSAFSLKSGVEKKKFSISGEAFGVGAYEEEDEDVYNRNDMGDYDFSLDVAERPKSSKNRAHSESSKSISSLSDVLEGFQLSTSKSLLIKSFPPPAIPRHWKPKNTGYVRKTRFDQQQAPEKEPVRSSNPSRDQRRSILFPVRDIETPVQTVPAVKEEKDSGELEELPDFLNTADLNASSQNSFQPFVNNSSKQTRYEQFLVCIKNNRRDALKLLQPKEMTEWERERERVEFERAAHLYKPMNTSMTSRFVSAGTSKDESDVAVSEGSEKMKAAQLKMFGKLTRESVEWVPARILCVRFNVKNPFGDSKEPETKKKKKNVFGSNQLFSLLDGGGAADDKKQRDGNAADTAGGVKEEVEEDTVEVKEEQEARLTVTLVKEEEEINGDRPPMDLFKAIFANSDSEDDEKSEDEDSVEEVVVKKPAPQNKPPIPDRSKPERNLNDDAARGIFAGINFDKFIKRRKKTPPPIVRERVAPTRPKSILDQALRTHFGIKSGDISDDDFGPKLPPQAAVVKNIVISSDSESDEWEEKSNSKKKKKKDKKEKKEKRETAVVKKIVISSDSASDELEEKSNSKKKKKKEKKEKKKNKKQKSKKEY